MFSLCILMVLQPQQCRLHSAYAGIGLRRLGSFGPDTGNQFGRPEMVKFVKLIKNEKGATAIEYGLIAALIAVAAIGAMQGIGNKLNTTFNNVSNNLG